MLLEASEDKEDPELKNQFGEIIEIGTPGGSTDRRFACTDGPDGTDGDSQTPATKQSKFGFIDPESPYFGHMPLLENGRERDLLIGSGNCFPVIFPVPLSIGASLPSAGFSSNTVKVMIMSRKSATGKSRVK